MGREAVEVQMNPFTAAARATEDTKRFSSPAQLKGAAESVECLQTDGFIILPDCIDRENVQAIASEFARLHTNDHDCDTEFAGFKTRRMYNLVARTRILDQLYLHPKILAIVEAHLDDQIQLSIASTIDLGAGETQQPFHRDDSYYPMERPHMPLSVNAILAIDDFTGENGGTVLIPRSHLTADEEPPRDAEIVTAEMSAGSVLMWDGSLFHAGGANRTDARRLGISAIYCRAWLRQQENQFLGVPVEIAKTLPRSIQKLIGYWVVNNLLGYVNDASPLRLLD
ncbi:MAG: ectoine hydroxylase-related dioxygenase (phytanoyl-CoA dioxygenase family) [Gammaproteobacteria bacterium]|jgi:ectoine hydroxylase-related dioxygenase (phytanoyl-CoA dioxygenase family)